MAASAWVIHEAFKSRLLNKELDLDTDDIKVGLASSASNVNTASVNNYASITNELATANGYTAGGVACTGETIAGTSTVTFDTANVVWVASGGSITARYAFMYDNTDTNKTIIAHCVLDSTPADVTATDGNTLTITIANVFSLA